MMKSWSMIASYVSVTNRHKSEDGMYDSQGSEWKRATESKEISLLKEAREKKIVEGTDNGIIDRTGTEHPTDLVGTFKDKGRET